MNLEVLGRWLLFLGAGIALMGGLLWLVGRFFPQGGEFPGTIRIQGAGFTCVIPLLASILFSLLLTVILNVIARWMK
jgi:hypothetical protein